MTIHRANLVWDDEKHITVHLGMSNHDEPDAAYLRKCVEFYEMNKAGTTGQQLILEHLQAIRRMLQNGVMIGAGEDTPPDPQSDEIMDDLLEQIE